MMDQSHEVNDRINSLAMALKEALIWGWVEGKDAPFKIPSAISGDLWKWTTVYTKEEAYRIITRAVEKAKGSSGKDEDRREKLDAISDGFSAWLSDHVINGLDAIEAGAERGMLRWLEDNEHDILDRISSKTASKQG